MWSVIQVRQAQDSQTSPRTNKFNYAAAQVTKEVLENIRTQHRKQRTQCPPYSQRPGISSFLSQDKFYGNLFIAHGRNHILLQDPFLTVIPPKGGLSHIHVLEMP